jgi:hypothetical protein
MKKKRANIFVIDNRKEFRKKLERKNPEIKNVNMGIDKTVDVDNSKRKVV